MLTATFDPGELHAAFASELSRLQAGAAEAVDEAGKTCKATARVLAPHRSYALRDSIEARLETSNASGAEGFCEATANHASFMEDGTIPHIIEPKRKKWLRFEGQAGWVFAKRVSHPGTNALGFMRRAAEAGQLTIERVAAQVADRVAESLSR